jgi:hypothetical protein
MLTIKWLKFGLNEACFDGQKFNYELEEKDIIVKRLSRHSLEEQKKRYRFLRDTIKDNLPETSLVKACDENGNVSGWIVQEKIYGRWLGTILHPDEKIFKKAWGQYSEIVKKCPEIDDHYCNFVWDDRKNRLIYTSY